MTDFVAIISSLTLLFCPGCVCWDAGGETVRVQTGKREKWMLPPSHASCLSLIFQVSVSRCCPLGESRRARKFPSGLPCSPSRIYLLLSLRKHFPHVIVTFCCNGARDGQIINRPDNTSLLFASFFFLLSFFCVPFRGSRPLKCRQGPPVTIGDTGYQP